MVRKLLIACVVVAATALGSAGARQTPYRTHNDRFAAPRLSTLEAWTARAEYVRGHVLASAGLLPLPDKTPLRPSVFGEVKRAGYLVSKVYFESLPGLFVTGNLYRPIGDGPFPAVLSPHGHWTYGRLENTPTNSGPGRAIGLARQGVVVFSYDMVGYNDSQQVPHTFADRRAHLWGLSLAGLQLWNSIRALDFLETLPYVQREALAATGESGGGTQTFLLAAVDSRVKVAVPVNMISLHMQGGCLCENAPGLRRDLTNVDIAATIAPRPLLMISATGDWTAETMEVEYPAVRAVYELVGAADRVQAVRMTAEHNYNKDSREAMYAWMARWLQQAPPDVRIAERAFTVEPLPDLLVFHQRPRPVEALTPPQLIDAWIAAAKRQLGAAPSPDAAAALRHALGPGIANEPNGAVKVPPSNRSVLVAHSDGAVAQALSRAGFTIRPVALTPFDESAAAKVPHFDTYNRTAAGQRVADIVAAVRANPGAAIVADGDAALAALLASAVAPAPVAVLDVGRFDTASDAGYLERLYIPGLRRAGDLQTAASLARGRVVVHNAGDRFAVTGVELHPRMLTPAQIADTMRRAPAARAPEGGAPRALRNADAWLPKSILSLRGYDRVTFRHDLVAGVTVGLVALPLAMAFAIASGLTPRAGIYCAIVTGFIISAFGGSRVQIGGPTGAFVVVVSGIVAEHGISGLYMCTMMAGAMLVILGVTGTGTAVRYIPRPVVIGFTNGIAILRACPGAGAARSAVHNQVRATEDTARHRDRKLLYHRPP